MNKVRYSVSLASCDSYSIYFELVFVTCVKRDFNNNSLFSVPNVQDLLPQLETSKKVNSNSLQCTVSFTARGRQVTMTPSVGCWTPRTHVETPMMTIVMMNSMLVIFKDFARR